MATTVTFSQDIMVLVGSLLALFATALVTHAFNFSFNSPTSCDDLTVSWTGSSILYQRLASRHSHLCSQVEHLPSISPFSQYVHSCSPSYEILTFSLAVWCQAFHVPQNFTIPETAFADGSGTFSTPLTLDRRQRLLLSMSDATGFNTGGVSRVLKVGASQSDNRCNISENRIDFLFWSLRPLVQCSYVPKPLP
jgi:hypothetical protein